MNTEQLNATILALSECLEETRNITTDRFGAGFPYRQKIAVVRIIKLLPSIIQELERVYDSEVEDTGIITHMLYEKPLETEITTVDDTEVKSMKSGETASDILGFEPLDDED